MRIRRILFPLLAALLALAPMALPAQAGEANMSFAEAQAAAQERGVPLVIDFFTDWCVYCKHFDADLAKAESGLSEALSKVVFMSIDAEKGDGIELAKKYEVSGFPTYIMMDAEGEVIDRWSGYGGPEHFLGAYEPALSDPMTLVEKQARFDANPTAADAQLFARIAMGSGKYDEAITLYDRAEELDGSLALHSDRFWAGYYSMRRGGKVDSPTLQKMAKAVVGAEGTKAGEIASVASVMTRVATKEEADFHKPFLKKAMAMVDQMEERPASEMKILGALHVDNDKALAGELKKASMPEGWMEDADALNNFAWWSFENGVNLEEAEMLARKGIELAEPGKAKAMILDTAAEICNARGDCRDAVTLIEMAIENDPESKSYPKQLERFQKILASQ